MICSRQLFRSEEIAPDASIGVQDLIIVQTPDALLIADRHSADAIKKLVDLVPPELH